MIGYLSILSIIWWHHLIKIDIWLLHILRHLTYKRWLRVVDMTVNWLSMGRIPTSVLLLLLLKFHFKIVEIVLFQIIVCCGRSVICLICWLLHVRLPKRWRVCTISAVTQLSLLRITHPAEWSVIVIWKPVSATIIVKVAARHLY